MRKVACWFLAPVFACFLATSCGVEADSAGSCGGFTACGGPLEGTWDAAEFCVTGDLLAVSNQSAAEQSTSCSSLFSEISYQYVVSSIQVPPNQAIVGSIRYTGSAVQFLTDSCSLDLMSTEVSPEVCRQYEAALVTKQQWTEASCVGRDSCTCSGLLEPTPTSLVFDSTAGTLFDDHGRSVPYCVQGDTLTVLDKSRATDIVVRYHRR